MDARRQALIGIHYGTLEVQGFVSLTFCHLVTPILMIYYYAINEQLKVAKLQAQWYNHVYDFDVFILKLHFIVWFQAGPLSVYTGNRSLWKTEWTV